MPIPRLGWQAWATIVGALAVLAAGSWWFHDRSPGELPPPTIGTWTFTRWGAADGPWTLTVHEGGMVITGPSGPASRHGIRILHLDGSSAEFLLDPAHPVAGGRIVLTRAQPEAVTMQAGDWTAAGVARERRP